MKEFNWFYDTQFIYPIVNSRKLFFFLQGKNNVFFIHLIIVALLIATLTSAAFAQSGRGSSIPQPKLPLLASNDHNHVIGRAADNLYIRSENYLGCNLNKNKYNTEKQIIEYEDCIKKGHYFSSEKKIILPAKSKGFVDLPKMASKFLADKDNTSVAITFSALANNNSSFDSPLLIRVLVDGVVAEPNQITLRGGQKSIGTPSVQSFTFLTNVNKGIHTAQVQYSTSEIDKGDSSLRNATLTINTGITGIIGKKILENYSNTWMDIDGSELNFIVPEDGKVAITFSSVVKNEEGNQLWLKAIIDDGSVESYPNKTLLAERLYQTEARSVTFTAENLTPGEHSVRFEQFNPKPEIEAQLKSWSVLIKSNPKTNESSFFDILLQKDSLITNSSEYIHIPGLETDVLVDEVSDIAVTLSGYASGVDYAIATVTLDDIPFNEHEVSIHEGFQDCLETDSSGFACAKLSAVYNSGVRSYTFGLKNIPPKDSPYKIGLAIKSGIGNPSEPVEEGIIINTKIDNSIMVVEKKIRVGPDLAVGPNMGRGSKKFETIIEPIYGKRKLLTIIIDPLYISEPVSPKFAEVTDDYIYGDSNSVTDYYKVVSNNRLQIEKAGILGPYLADHAGVVSNGENYYQDDSNYDCKNGAEFESGGNALHVEAINQADNEIDFSQFDMNNDGKILPAELGIVIVIPAAAYKGTQIYFNPYCDKENKIIVDGVEIPETVHFNTKVDNSVEDYILHTQNMMIVAHELGHHFLKLDDIYSEGMFNTPGKLSLMDDVYDSTTHLDAFHKLHLGWARPVILEENKAHTLHDIKNREDTIIFPRRNTDSREYILLESRFNGGSIDSEKYDYGINDSGLAVYHITEPDDSCKINYQDYTSPLDAAPNCKPLQKPICMSNEKWLGGHFSNFIRTGLRLISPDLSHQNSEGELDYAESLFGVANWMDDVNLLDYEMLACPEKIGAPLPNGILPSLLWSDGKSSGYKLFDIEIDHVANKTTFNLTIN